MNRKTKYIAYTALFTALTLVLQVATAPFGQLVTGSAVNFVLIAVCLLIGLRSAITVAVVAPIAASLIGIGSGMLQLVPVIIIGNAVFVSVFALVIRIMKKLNRILSNTAALLISSAAKYASLYIGVLKIAVPMLGLPEKAAAKLSASFGVIQLFTALIGGALAMVTVPLIKKAIKR